MRPLGRAQDSKTAKDDGEVLDIAAILHHYGFGYLPEAAHGWRKVRCEFHGERQASATVNFELGAFKCFACEFQGDTLKIIQLAEQKEGRHCGFTEACRIYQEVTGRPVSGVRVAASGESGRAVATESRDYEEGNGFLRSRLRRDSHEGRPHTPR